jgi:mRNA interferase RelE/StbE
MIQWTKTALDHLEKLPKDVRRGLYNKIDSLKNSDPRQAGKPLTGPLLGYRSITYGRYRAIFTVSNEMLASGDVLVHIQIVVVAAGIRREHHKSDVYHVAQKLVELGNHSVAPGWLDHRFRAAF